MKKPVRAKRGGSDSRSLRVTTMANTYGKREGEAGLGRERFKLQCNSKKRSVKSMAVLKLTSSFFFEGGGVPYLTEMTCIGTSTMLGHWWEAALWEYMVVDPKGQ